MKKIINIAAALVLAGTAFAAQPSIDIVPRPQEIKVTEGAMQVKGVTVYADAKFDVTTLEAIGKFSASLGRVTVSEINCRITGQPVRPGSRGISFVKSDNLAKEAYRLVVKENTAVVEASSRAGVLYAIQTLKQMLPVKVYGNEPAPEEDWRLACCEIFDAPRFEYRGMHLDCCRHFFTLDEVRRYIDAMAIYKMNRLHWHLTEDQGWRVEIKKYPRLTEVGAFRNGTMIGKDFKSNDGIRYGGFYTQEEVKEIISYADERGITVIPEVDLPGHMLAALASYPELGCEGSQPYEVWTIWGVSKQVLSVGKEDTMKFLEDVVGELADIFPSEYFHIGGDECPKDEWKNDPACQAKIKELGLVSDEKASAEARLQNYVTARIQNYLAAKGKKIIGWDEILEGELAPGATVMSWRGTKGGIAASNAGYDVIMTPNNFCYFDYRQLEDKDAQPLAIGSAYLPFSKVYSCNPTEGLSSEAASHIRGVQANMWTEYVATPEHLEFMVLPRMLALSEVQWCTLENKDLDRISSSLDNHQSKILDLLGYNYCKQHE
ncbi:MAG: beta-N-acetylhexosaminidase [Bacteroidales bacterium]|nr:beta-N-acetylhexosaminidase [Candidatus Cacconaster merdequi]